MKKEQIAALRSATGEIIAMTDEELFENFDPEKCKSEYTAIEIEEWERWLALAHEIRRDDKQPILVCHNDRMVTWPNAEADRAAEDEG